MKTIKITPIPAPRPRFSKYGTYNPAKYTNYKKALAMHLKALDLAKIQGGPLSLCVRFYLPIPASLSKKKRLELDGKDHIKKPDLDNLLKAFKDSANEILWSDDSQVSNTYSSKEYSLEPKIEFKIKPVSE